MQVMRVARWVARSLNRPKECRSLHPSTGGRLTGWLGEWRRVHTQARVCACVCACRGRDARSPNRPFPWHPPPRSRTDSLVPLQWR